MKTFIYAVLTFSYLFLVVAGLVVGTSWFNMIWIIFGLVYFGSKFMDRLE